MVRGRLRHSTVGDRLDLDADLQKASINSEMQVQLWRLKLIVEPAYATLSPVSCSSDKAGCVLPAIAHGQGKVLKSPGVTQSTATAASLLTIYPYGYAITCDICLRGE